MFKLYVECARRYPILTTLVILFALSGPITSYMLGEYGPVIDTAVVTSPYADETACARFTHAGGQVQTLCMDEFEQQLGPLSWLGATPAYVVEDGVHTSLF